MENPQDQLANAWLVDSRALFVTGTDARVGKTRIACAIAKYWGRAGDEVCAFKPVATGVLSAGEDPNRNEDAAELARVTTTGGSDLLACSGLVPGQSFVELEPPLAPLSAAEKQGTPFRYAEILELLADMVRHTRESEGRLVIEGVGGALVPLAKNKTIADLIAELEIPAVVVGRTSLGAINHMLATIEALRTRQVTIAAVVLSGVEGGVSQDLEYSAFDEIGARLPAKTAFLLMKHDTQKFTEIRGAGDMWRPAGKPF